MYSDRQHHHDDDYDYVSTRGYEVMVYITPWEAFTVKEATITTNLSFTNIHRYMLYYRPVGRQMMN